MGKSLFEYAAANPATDPGGLEGEAAATVEAITSEVMRQEQAEELKTSISRQIRQGAAPQYTLYTAVRAIGILTQDSSWTEEQTAKLDEIYNDLRQQSFVVDNEAAAAERREKMQADYLRRVRKRLTSELNGCKRIEKALSAALQAVEGFETEQAETKE